MSPLRRVETPAGPAMRLAHPDPTIETALERIRTLQARVGNKREQISDYQREIAAYHREIRIMANQAHTRQPGQVNWQEHHADLAGHDQRIKDLHETIGRLESEIDQSYEEIVQRQQALTPSDLSYL